MYKFIFGNKDMTHHFTKKVQYFLKPVFGSSDPIIYCDTSIAFPNKIL